VTANRTAVPPGRRGRTAGTDIRGSALRLAGISVLIWTVLTAIGYVLTHLSHGGIQRWDSSVDRSFAARRSSGWNVVTHVLTLSAETITVIAIGVVVFIGLRIMLGGWRASVFLAVALAGEVTIFVCITLAIDRARPPVSHLDHAPPTSSFPSGHTAAAVTLYGALAVLAWTMTRRVWLRSAATVVALVLPVAVALSRIYRGMHFPTDVMAGALLGLLWLSATAAILLRPRRGYD
jgi:membrane-associated phospholipid phosphatase